MKLTNRKSILAITAALAGCLSNTGDSLPPPSGIQAVSGDGVAGITWNSELGVSYLVFGSTNANITALNFLDPGINGFPLNNTGTSAQPPALICSSTAPVGWVANGQSYYFTINSRTGTAPGGPGSPAIKVTPRAAGGAGTWTLGTPIGASANAVAFVPISGCYSRGLPNGDYIAVGPAGSIHRSTDAHTWASQAPAGYTTDLFAVAGYTVPLSTSTTPAFLMVAVGAGGASITSADGITWKSQVAANGSAPALRAISIVGTTFVAVGDGGRIQTSLDGLNWTVQTSHTTVNLHAIQCAIANSASVCVAVGDSGVIDTSSDGGVTWTVQTVGGGASALRAVEYGDFDNNITSPGVVGIANNVFINTWVAVGDAGAVFVNSTGTWTSVPMSGAPNLVALSYTTQFVSLDGAGNAYTSQTGQSGTWSSAASTGLSNPAGITTTGHGFVAVGTSGENAGSF
jgi:hypothetical protein